MVDRLMCQQEVIGQFGTYVWRKTVQYADYFIKICALKKCIGNLSEHNRSSPEDTRPLCNRGAPKCGRDAEAGIKRKLIVNWERLIVNLWQICWAAVSILGVRVASAMPAEAGMAEGPACQIHP
jgi:hypothetical protein